MANAIQKLRVLALAAVATVTAFYPMAAVAAAAARVYGWVEGAMLSPQSLSQAQFSANTLTGLIPTMYVALQKVSREFVGFLPSVMRDSQVAQAAKGQLITSPIVPQGTLSDITPGVTAPNDGDQVIGYQTLSLTKARYYPIRWNGEEQKGLNSAGGPGAMAIMEQQLIQGFRTIVNEMEQDLAATAYKFASRASGTPGTAPFGTASDLSDFAMQANILDVNGAPASTRTMVLSGPSMTNVRGKQSTLFRVNESGTDQLLRQGTVGRVEGFDIGYSPSIQQVIKGTGSAYVTSGTYAKGATAITLATGTGTVLQGDCVTFAGDTNVYVVAGGVAAPGVITLASPGLQQSLASGVAMTIGNSFTPNLSFSQDALLLATRLPAMPMDMNGNVADMADDVVVVTDPFTGISFQLVTYRQYRQVRTELGAVWGVAAPNPEHLAVLRG